MNGQNEIFEKFEKKPKNEKKEKNGKKINFKRNFSLKILMTDFKK